MVQLLGELGELPDLALSTRHNVMVWLRRLGSVERENSIEFKFEFTEGRMLFYSYLLCLPSSRSFSSFPRFLPFFWTAHYLNRNHKCLAEVQKGHHPYDPQVGR